MKKLELSEWANVAEIVAAVGVIVSLAYVGLGLKENAAAVRAATVQSITNSSRNFLLTIALDEDFARIRDVGQADRSALTDAEASRFYLFSRGNWLYFQNVWIQWQLGVVDDRMWRSSEQIICSILDLPGNREEWAYHVEALDPEFVALAERCSS